MPAPLRHAAPLLPFVLLPAAAWAGVDSDLQACRSIADTAQRVECYDAVADSVAARPVPQSEQEAEARPGGAVTTGPSRRVTSEFGQSDAPVDENAGARITRYWELDQDSQRGRFIMLPYKRNYILPVSWNAEPNEVPFAGSSFEPEKAETKFQISLKFKLWQDILNDRGDLWFTYTQQSHWQLYRQESAPFRETNYEPALTLTWPVSAEAFGFRARMLSLSFDHQSNGRGEPLSRSWNRLIAGAMIERGNLAIGLRAWYRFPENAEDDDNPHVEDYVGNGDVFLSWKRGRNEWTATIRNNFDFSDNRGSIELGWAFGIPLTPNLSGYVQYFYGYGETLLDYDAITNRIGIGLLVSDWF